MRTGTVSRPLRAMLVMCYLMGTFAAAVSIVHAAHGLVPLSCCSSWDEGAPMVTAVPAAPCPASTAMKGIHALRGRSATRGGHKPHCGALFSGQLGCYSGSREINAHECARNPKRSPRSRATSRSRGGPVPPRHYTRCEAREVSYPMGAGKPAGCGSGGSCATEQPPGCPPGS